ncbi:Cys-tRNA(Pro) deacylase [Arthrobacter echini]|uniref:Cys-tRNA(Pro)/Cys-tRNA(Cys) deacylase n=1 Tax=Arthrobacter echini TaxID=1529066 RepID=A0A4S5E278_9MICC|nr:Cys-tRNA(Pro) deacylase [Arthrobacter echini]THJ65488.1 Cys-tRNA(Pro) deacylase [Arthrobacter echini]
MGRKQTGSRGTPALAALTAAQVPFTERPYTHEEGAPSYGLEAAAALGVDPVRVFKTLMTSVDGALACAVVPVDGSLDLKALAAVLGGRKAALADPAVAERRTGYVLGGISPIGQRQRSPVVVDVSVLDHATVLVSGGRRGLDIELAPTDLLAVTGARLAAIAGP